MDIDIGSDIPAQFLVAIWSALKKMAVVVFVEAIPTWHLEVAGENVLWLLY